MNFISKIGIDKFAHFGLGGLVAAIVNYVCILQEVDITPGATMLMRFIGDLVAVFLALVKDYIIDSSSPCTIIQF